MLRVRLKNSSTYKDPHEENDDQHSDLISPSASCTSSSSPSVSSPSTRYKPQSKYHQKLNKLFLSGGQEAVKKYKDLLRERSKLYDRTMSKEKRQNSNELAKLRMRKYRERQKEKNNNKPMTRKEREKCDREKELHRKKWREAKRDYRQRKKDNKKEEDKKDIVSNIDNEEEMTASVGPDKEEQMTPSVGTYSRAQIRSAKFRIRQVLPKDPKICEIALREVISELTPVKKNLLMKDGIICTPHTAERRIASEKVVKWLAEEEKTLRNKRSNKCLARRKIIIDLVTESKEKVHELSDVADGLPKESVSFPSADDKLGDAISLSEIDEEEFRPPYVHDGIFRLPGIDEETDTPSEWETVTPSEEQIVPPPEEQIVPPPEEQIVTAPEEETVPPPEEETVTPPEEWTVTPSDEEIVPPPEEHIVTPPEEETVTPSEEEIVPPCLADDVAARLSGVEEGKAVRQCKTEAVNLPEKNPSKTTKRKIVAGLRGLFNIRSQFLKNFNRKKEPRSSVMAEEDKLCVQDYFERSCMKGINKTDSLKSLIFCCSYLSFICVC